MSIRNKNKVNRTPEELFELFIEISKELQGCRLFQQGLGTSLFINWNSEGKLPQSESKNHDKDDLRSFLTIFRKFIAERSDIFMSNIYSLCAKYLTDDDLKKAVADNRKIWLKIQNSNEWDEKKPSYKIKLDGEEYLPKDLAKKWLNGIVFHDDLQDEEFFKSLGLFSSKCIKWNINRYINASVVHILNFAETIQAMRKHRKLKFD
ncbi:MAG: hypothetical protein ABIP78_12965 [Pyrinomonadaceae bacterium]